MVLSALMSNHEQHHKKPQYTDPSGSAGAIIGRFIRHGK